MAEVPSRTRVTIDADITGSARKEIADAVSDLKRLDKLAKEVIRKQTIVDARVRREFAAGGTAASLGAARVLTAAKKTPRMLSFTSEGIVAGGILKFSDTGFMLEGVVAKYGGPLLTAAVVGRIAAGGLGVAINVRDLINKGATIEEALLSGAANFAVDLPRTVGRVLGVEQVAVALGTLILGVSKQEAQGNLERSIKRIKDYFAPEIQQQIDEAFDRRLDEIENKKVLDITTAHAAMIESWSFSEAKKQQLEITAEYQIWLNRHALRQNEKLKLSTGQAEKGGG